MASILKLEHAPAGGDTLFANMYAAYDALSEPMKQFLGGLTATHDGPNYRDRAARVGKDVSHKVYQQTRIQSFVPIPRPAAKAST